MRRGFASTSKMALGTFPPRSRTWKRADSVRPSGCGRRDVGGCDRRGLIAPWGRGLVRLGRLNLTVPSWEAATVAA